MKKKLLMALLVGVLAVPSSVSCFAAESTDAAAADSDEEEETEETEAEDKDTTAKKKENLKTVGEKKDGCIAFKLRNATSKKIIGLAIKTADETEFTENMMEEDDSFEWTPLCCHCIYRWLIYIFLTELVYFFCIERTWREVSHSSCI